MLGAEKELKETYVKSGQVMLVFNPILDHGDRSVQAHNAAECAADQNRFWPMHDVLFEFESQLYGGDVRAVIKELAQQVDMDHDQFNRCVDAQTYVERVKTQDQRRRALGIRTRPTIDVNGQLFIGPQPFNVLQTAIQPVLE